MLHCAVHNGEKARAGAHRVYRRGAFPWRSADGATVQDRTGTYAACWAPVSTTSVGLPSERWRLIAVRAAVRMGTRRMVRVAL